MRPLGKILVFLVFLGALAMGGLMIYISKATPNWEAAVKERDAYIRVLSGNLQAEAESRKKLVNDLEKLRQQLDANLVEAKAEQQRLKLEIKDKEKQTQDALKQAEEAGANHALAQAEATRLQKELVFLQGVVEQREKTILKIQEEIRTAKNEEQAAKNHAETASQRALNLLEQVKEKEAVIAQLRKRDEGGKIITSVRDANYNNPPSHTVKGQVTAVDSTGKLVTLSIGSDQGLRTDQTLDVFRTSPKVEWLGRVLIVEADLRSSVARLLPAPGVQGPVTLMPGDQVASKLR